MQELKLMQKAVELSLFDLFECGPGPSSSHTIGPMKAGYDFSNLCKVLDYCEYLNIGQFRIKVKLYGSLSATGVGHRTHAAVIGGLLGYQPAQCPSLLLQDIMDNPEREYQETWCGMSVHFSLADIICADVLHDFPYNNTLEIFLYDVTGKKVISQRYYSVGGGFLQWENWEPASRGKPVHLYSNMIQLQMILHHTGLTLHEVILENEIAITGMPRPVILNKLQELLSIMEQSVIQGLDREGTLPGNLKVERKARFLHEKAKNLSLRSDRFIAELNARAFATSEQNADGGVIVTAPTCGAAGVLPSLFYTLRHDLNVGDRAILEGVLASASIGFLAKHNAAIAGAEVGCQGEIGVASAMGAAFVAHSRGASSLVTENAAEIALEHHLGLTCDPVGGFVQIPCIERNAMGALKAYNAYLLASTEKPEYHRVRLDSAIAAMNETGREMNAKFKETSLGGLAVSMVTC